VSKETGDCARAAAEQARQQLLQKLYDEGAISLYNKLNKCGEAVPLNCTECGEPRVGRSRCDQRWCPFCQRALAARTSLRYEKIASECSWPTVISLTTTHSVISQLGPKQLRRAFTKLRRLRWWKNRVKGGVAAFELTDNGNGWHTHVHALIDCQWLAVDEGAPPVGATKEAIRAKGKRSAKELSEQWSLCVGRPGSVHVRRVRGGVENMRKACAEVLKYAVKGTDLAAMKGDAAPVIREMAGSRLVVSWGTFYRHPAIKRQKPAPAMCKCGCDSWRIDLSIAQRLLVALKVTD